MNKKSSQSRRQKDVRKSDQLFLLLLRLLGLLPSFFIAGILVMLIDMAWPLLKQTGANFYRATNWDPVLLEFGALPSIYGTVVSSLLAILISLPVSLGVAIVVTELAPKWISKWIGFAVEMLAAIPSVVYGLWGIFVLAPWMRDHLQPILGEWLDFLPLFQGAPFGIGMLTAAIILAIMITPTIATICREVFKVIPDQLREASLALGSTRWEMIVLSVLRTGRSGILGATILGLGRALGETMAVTMVIGNRNEISASLFAPAQTMASLIANEYAEASDEIHLAALASVGLGLFLVSLLINSMARFVIWRVEKPMKGKT